MSSVLLWLQGQGCLKEEAYQLVQLGNSLHSYLHHWPFILWRLPCEKLARMDKAFLRSVLESGTRLLEFWCQRLLQCPIVTQCFLVLPYVYELLSSYPISKLHDCWWWGFICYLIPNSVLFHYFILVYPFMQLLFKQEITQKDRGLSLTFSMPGKHQQQKQWTATHLPKRCKMMLSNHK